MSHNNVFSQLLKLILRHKFETLAKQHHMGQTEPENKIVCWYKKNVMVTYLWITMCMHLLLVLIKFQSKSTRSMQQILLLLQLNLFGKRGLIALLRGDTPLVVNININQKALL